MKIYTFPMATANSQKVTFTAELLNIDYELIFLDPQKSEHKTPEFLKISPLGKIPALQDNDIVLAESNAICRFLCAINNNKLYGDTPIEKAKVDQWIEHYTHVIGPVVGTYIKEEFVKPTILNQPTDESNLRAADEQLAVLLPIVEAQLSQHTFLAGNTLSIADSIAHGYMSNSQRTTLSLNAYPKIKAWVEGLSALPAWKTMNARYA